MKDEDKKFYSERLDSLWGRYLAFVNFVIMLTGGTVLILLLKLVELKIEKKAIEDVTGLFWWALMIAAIISIYAIFWRALGQRYMEYEVLAPLGKISDYVGKESKPYTVTDVHRYENIDKGIYKFLYKLAPWVISTGLLISWFLIGLHLLNML